MRPNNVAQGRPLYSNREAGFFMDKMGEFVHIFAKGEGIFGNTFSVFLLKLKNNSA